MSNEPRTKAGRALLGMERQQRTSHERFSPEGLLNLILVIEAEAAAGAGLSCADCDNKVRLVHLYVGTPPSRSHPVRLSPYRSTDDSEGTIKTLAELNRLADPLHACVITREAWETMAHLAWEAGRNSALPEQKQ